MKTQQTRMNRNTMARGLSTLLLSGVCLAPVWVVSTAQGVPAAGAKPAEIDTIKGTCLFNGKESTWSAKLTAKGNGTYDAVYVSSWGGTPLSYVGTIKTDLKTEISGSGKGSGGRSNGTFEFSGKFDANNVAQCSYKEVGGRRKGTMTAELPK
jgi:hypothetical protein